MLHQPGYGYCAVGAIDAVVAPYAAPFNEALTILEKTILCREDGLSDWNDKPHRTAEEVIDVLVAAAYGDFDQPQKGNT
jgi:hypothetical protein